MIENTAGKTSLLKQFDTLRRDIDQSGMMSTMDKFQQQALELVLGSEAAGRLRYRSRRPEISRSLWPVTVGAIHAHGPAAGRGGRDIRDRGHAALGRPQLESRRPTAPRCRSWTGRSAALIDDLDERGLLDRVMVIVMGEFGRTPRINTGQPGIPVPGRDHWGNAISALMAGGGIAGRCGGGPDQREGRTSG